MTKSDVGEVLRFNFSGWRGGLASGNKAQSSLALPMGLGELLVLQRIDHSLSRLADHLGRLISDLQGVGAHRHALLCPGREDEVSQ